MKKIICAIVAGISVVAAFGQAVRTFNSTNELVAAGHNPMSQNTNSWVINTNDMSYQMWTWFQGDTSVASTYNLESLRPGVVGRYKLVENLHWNRAGDVNGDTYVIYSFLTNFVATNVISGASVWTNDAGIVRLINMTLPVKITNSILLSDGGTNVIFVDPSNGRDLVLSNSATTPPVFLQVKSAGTPGTSAKFGVLSDGSTKVMSSSGKSIWLSPNAGIDGDYLFSNTALSPSVANKSLGQYGYPWTNFWLNGYARIQGTNDGVGNYSYTDFSQQNTNSPFVINQQTGGTAGYSRGISIETNGVNLLGIGLNTMTGIETPELYTGSFKLYRGALTPADAGVSLDFSSTNRYWSISLTGAVTFATANLTAGKHANVMITGVATNAAYTWPANWVWIGYKPTYLTATKHADLYLKSTGTTDAGVWVYYGEEQ